MIPFLDVLTKVVGKIVDNTQGRIERVKNEKESLLNEKSIILSKPISSSSIKRIDIIESRLLVINKIIENNAKD